MSKIQTLQLVAWLRSVTIHPNFDTPEGMSLEGCASRMENQSKSLSEKERYINFMKDNNPLMHRNILNAIKQNIAVSDLPSPEVEGDWV